MFPPGDTIKIPLNWELNQLAGEFGPFMSLSQQGKKGVTVLMGVTDLAHRGESE